MTQATIIVPTYNHGPLLKYSIKSILQQTLADFEVIIIGDGVPVECLPVIEEIVSWDSRITFLKHKKSTRTGELYRHQVLQKVQSDMVCYLSDDDLWLPDYLAVTYEHLKTYDFINTMAVRVNADQTVAVLPVDIQNSEYRQLIKDTVANRIPLSGAAHTLAFYQRLPFGWRTTPEGTPTDHFMWKQVLSEEVLKCFTQPRALMLNFPSPLRVEKTLDEREQELSDWLSFISDPQAEQQLQQRLYHSTLQQLVQSEAQKIHAETALESAQKNLKEVSGSRIYKMSKMLLGKVLN